MKKDNGITLIALVVIIIVLLILAGISLNYATGDTNLIQKSKEAMFKSDAKDLKDMWDARVAGIDATNINYDNVEDVIGVEKIPESLRGIFAIENGKLVYKSDIDSLSDEQKSWLLEVGINQSYIIPLDIKIKASFSQVIQNVNSKAADVIFVLDVSMSMDENIMQEDGSNSKRYQAMFAALNSAIPTIMNANEKNRFAIVTYCETNKVVVPLAHYEAASDAGYFIINQSNTAASHYHNYSKPCADTNFKNYQNTTIKMGPGTGTRGGMARACLVINGRDTNDQTYGKNEPIIILLTDGEPNRFRKEANMNNIDTYANNESGSYNNSYYDMSYWTIKLGCAIKDYYKEKNLQLITINFNEGVLSAMVLNPTGYNESNTKYNSIANSTEYLDLYNKYRRNSLTSKEKARFQYLNDLLDNINQYKNVCNDLASAYNKGEIYNYPDKAYAGEFTTSELESIFNEISVEIAKATDVEIGEEREGAILNVTDDMKYYNEETHEWVDLKLDTKGTVTVNVVASVYEKPDNDSGVATIKKDPSGKDMSITYTKSYTVGQIMSGVDPNLSYTNGNITWNIRADFDERYTASKNNVRNLALQELSKRGFKPDTDKGEVTDVGYIEIIVPVVVDDGT